MLKPGWRGAPLMLGGAAVAVVVAAMLAWSAGSSQMGDSRSSGASFEAHPALPDAGLPGALLMEYTRAPGPASLQPMPDGWKASLWPLEAGTLREIPDHEPTGLGYQASRLLSPDATMMAGTEYRGAEVRLFDLERWQAVGVIRVESGVQPVAWSADGKHIYAARNHCAEPADRGACPGGWLRELWALDVPAKTARRVAEVDFESARWHFAGNRAVTLAVRTDVCCGIDPEGDPFVTVIDLDSGEVAGEIKMPGLRMGQPGHWLGDTSEYASYWPGTALSPDGSSFYVMDSVDHVVTVVDVEEMRIASTHDLKEPRSHFTKALDWMESLFVSTAEAKGGPSYYRQVEITPDGRFLVSSGRVSLPDQDPDHQADYKTRPAGLLVIDVSTMRVVYREETSSSFVMSPDGRWLLATGSYWDEDLADDMGFGGDVYFGLRIIDLRAMEETAHLWVEEDARPAAVSPDSRFAYVIADGPGILESRVAGTGCAVACWRVSLVDLASGAVIAERPLDMDFSVVPVAPGR
jgi:hypothetical protein